MYLTGIQSYLDTVAVEERKVSKSIMRKKLSPWVRFLPIVTVTVTAISLYNVHLRLYSHGDNR